ncbi:helix-turn-helix domain-containing protein [Streptomyces sp. NPDC001889]
MPRPRHRNRLPQPRGYLLTRARDARGWTQTELARRLCALSLARGRSLRTGRDGVSHWENNRSPDLPTQFLIADLLGIPRAAVHERPWPQWLSEDPAQRPAPRSWTLPGAAQSLTELAAPGSAVDTTRRDLVLIAGSTLTASLLAWITADPVAAGQLTTGRRIGDAAVTRVEDRVRMLRRMDDTDGGGAVLTEAASALALVRGLIRTRTYTAEQGARLYAAASDLARQHAAAAFDIHGACADRAFDTALRTAHAAGDTALGANALAFWTVSAYNTGRLQDAETMATTALAAVRGTATPRVEALVLTRRGRARAHLGDGRCWADFDRAETLFAQADERGETGPDWSYWFDRAEILSARASSHRDLGEHQQAERLFGRATSLFASDAVRDRALYLTRQAEAQLAQGHIDHATATANTALDLTETISSHRTTTPLLTIADRLTPSPLTAARDFAERARTILAA